MVESADRSRWRVKWIVAIAIGCAIVAFLVFAGQRLFFASAVNNQVGPLDSSADAQLPKLPVKRGAPWQEVDDPTNDGWATEEFHRQAKKQLAALGSLLVQPDEIDARAADLVTDDFSCSPLRSGGLTTVFADRVFSVERGRTTNVGPEIAEQRPKEPGPKDSQKEYRGADGFVQAVLAAADAFSAATDTRYEFKVFDVRSAADEVTTRQHVALFGRTATGALEQHATWQIRWAPGDSKSLPRIRAIRVLSFEQTATRQAAGVLFTDCTESVLGGNACYRPQLLRGMNHWLERNQEPRYIPILGNPGLAVGDVNDDGLEDLYFCQEAGLPNRLFIQNPDGSARDESASWGVDWLESSRSALLVDLDNDGDQDLVVAILGGVAVAENDGAGAFKLRDVLASGDDTMSLSAVDYDQDGRLDIYVCVYIPNEGLDNSSSAPLPGAAEGFIIHDANDGGRNSLWHNEISTDGAWRFRNVTRETGLDARNHRYSFASAWDDFDNDGDLDLYVANDYGRDNYYRNEGAISGAVQFVDVSDEARVENSAGGMSITCGDYDRDGWMDTLVSNMWSSAGQRITHQEQFKPDVPPEIRRRYQRQARGNTLLRNLGDGTFVDRSSLAGVEMGRWAWGSHFVDLNNDGWEDIVVTNGFITTDDTGDL